MTRRAPPSDLQADLDIGEAAFDPTSRDALRAAYAQSFYRERGIRFEDALEDRGLYLCLKNLALALYRRQREARHHHQSKDPQCA